MKLSREDVRRLGLVLEDGVRVKLAPLDSPTLLASHLRMWCERAGVPPPEPEHEFHPERGWRFDYAWPAAKVAMEVEGGTRKQGGGRHNRADGYERDCEKYNAAALLGWRVLRYTTKQVEQGRQWADLEEALTAETTKEANRAE